MKAPRQNKKISRLVDYYVANRMEEEAHIREALEYFWGCMSDGTIEDHIEMIEEGECDADIK